MPTGSEPVSVDNLKTLVGGGFFGGVVLFSGDSAMAALSQPMTNFSFVEVDYACDCSGGRTYFTVVIPGTTTGRTYCPTMSIGQTYISNGYFNVSANQIACTAMGYTNAIMRVVGYK